MQHGWLPEKLQESKTFEDAEIDAYVTEEKTLYFLAKWQATK